MFLDTARGRIFGSLRFEWTLVFAVSCHELIVVGHGPVVLLLDSSKVRGNSLELGEYVIGVGICLTPPYML